MTACHASPYDRLDDAFRAESADVDRGVPQSRSGPLSRGGRAQRAKPAERWMVCRLRFLVPSGGSESPLQTDQDLFNRRHRCGCPSPSLPLALSFGGKVHNALAQLDRKSTRLNSSPLRHLVCRLLLEKKK